MVRCRPLPHLASEVLASTLPLPCGRGTAAASGRTLVQQRDAEPRSSFYTGVATLVRSRTVVCPATIEKELGVGSRMTPEGTLVSINEYVPGGSVAVATPCALVVIVATTTLLAFLIWNTAPAKGTGSSSGR